MNRQIQPSEKEKISGTVMQVIYSSSENDYTVIRFLTDGMEETVAVGKMPLVYEEDELILYGEWTVHKEHGKQFSVDAYEKRLPQNTEGIFHYLSSKNVKGVGPVTALKIVNRFGIDTFDVIEHHPEWLTDVAGITGKKAAQIHASFMEQAGIRLLMTLCKDILDGVTIARVYNTLGANAATIIRENPYRLCREVYGIGFREADKIAASLGFDRLSPIRMINGIRYILQTEAAQGGHTCLPMDALLVAASELLGVSDTLVLEVCRASAEEEIFIHISPTNNVSYVYDGDMYITENTVIEDLGRIASGAPAYSVTDAGLFIDRIQEERGIVYAALQRQAIRDSLESGVMILTGGPGTGKTTVIQGLLRIYDYLGLRTALAAPTGRAAKHMSEATGEEARTVHRLLETERDEEGRSRFNRTRKNPLEEKVIIVDEASMLDLPLFSALLKAVPRGGRLVLIGDADQLPSVGCGNVLRDLIASGIFRTVSLDEIFRQSAESLIVTNAHRIHRGEHPILDVKDKDFFFLPRKSDSAIAATVAELLARRLPRTYGDAAKDVQVVTPSRRGLGGTEHLNALLQESLNPKDHHKKEIRFRGRIFRVNDRVMQNRNNYDIEWEKNGNAGYGVFNGDIGVILEIQPRDEIMTVRFEEKIANYPFSLLEELEHAYAITVHKSQGSEYDTVVIPLYTCPLPLMTRNLIYTAVTRAKNRVILVGHEEILARMIENNRQDLRYTLLKERLLRRYS